MAKKLGKKVVDYAAEFARKGGKARAKKLTPEQRSKVARKAAQARWKPDEVVILQPDLDQDRMESKLYDLMDRAIKLAGAQNFDLPCTASFLDGDGNRLWAVKFRQSVGGVSCTSLLEPNRALFRGQDTSPGYFVTMEDCSGRKVMVKVSFEGQVVN